MKCDLSRFAEKKICVAVSGGKDSMALLHYLFLHGKEYGITLSALNCDHKIRGESARDSAFVKEWCLSRNIPLTFFEWNYAGAKTETSARLWRLECYAAVLKKDADLIATAHHQNDNAETVLFNLARGSALAGVTGITDSDKIIHPLISVSRSEIDEYIAENAIEFVQDETNFSDDYTRNKIRRHVLPELEKAVNGAAGAIYRFSRLAAEDEKFFDDLIKSKNLLEITPYGAEIKFCPERPVFRRAAVKALKLLNPEVKDYTFEHLERLYALQSAENGKRFEFLSFAAFKEEGRISICHKDMLEADAKEYPLYNSPFVKIVGEYTPAKGEKALKIDQSAIPETAVVRFMRAGDRFRKFGGGEKSLGDFFTDRKVPLRLRGKIPLIADGNEILVVCGVEISDKLKITENTEKVVYAVCYDFSKKEKI